MNTYRALCKLRIAYAKCMIETLEDSYDTRGIDWDIYQKQISFWTKVQGYWEGKLSVLKDTKPEETIENKLKETEEKYENLKYQYESLCRALNRMSYIQPTAQTGFL